MDSLFGLESKLTNDPKLAETQKSRMISAWVLSGIFFMAFPGTLLGFSNLIAIAAHRGLGTMPPAWMEGHGHAQIYGWIGSFILGIGFYSQPARGRSALLLSRICFVLWTSGAWLRWIANIYEWNWRTLLPVSSALELAAMLLFVFASSQHKRSDSGRGGMEPWMLSVLLGTVGLTAAVVFNLVECVRLAAHGSAPSFPHALDQKYLVLLGWGFLVPVVWGFSARWLPAFLSIASPRIKALRLAIALDIFGIGAGECGWGMLAGAAFLGAAASVVFALGLLQRPHGRAKVQGVHSSFPVFVRLAYVWLNVAAAMTLWAALADQRSGIWGASRHALTVGFVATMVFAIGPRILPHFCGLKQLFSPLLMFVSLALLQTGCLLRVASEPMAYEFSSPWAWRILPISATLELVGVLAFAANISITILFKRSVLDRRWAPQRS